MHFNGREIDIDVFENKRCGNIAESSACQSERSTAASTRIGLKRGIRFNKNLRSQDLARLTVITIFSSSSVGNDRSDMAVGRQ